MNVRPVRSRHFSLIVCEQFPRIECNTKLAFPISRVKHIQSYPKLAYFSLSNPEIYADISQPWYDQESLSVPSSFLLAFFYAAGSSSDLIHIWASWSCSSNSSCMRPFVATKFRVVNSYGFPHTSVTRPPASCMINAPAAKSHTFKSSHRKPKEVQQWKQFTKVVNKLNVMRLKEQDTNR